VELLYFFLPELFLEPDFLELEELFFLLEDFLVAIAKPPES
jgi:hypothetical protein